MARGTILGLQGSPGLGHAFQCRACWLSCAGEARQALQSNPADTPQQSLPPQPCHMPDPVRTLLSLGSHSGQAGVSTGPQGTWPKEALPQGPHRLLLPTEASSPTQAARSLPSTTAAPTQPNATWGAAPSSLPRPHPRQDVPEILQQVPGSPKPGLSRRINAGRSFLGDSRV